MSGRSEPLWRRVLRLRGPDPRADVHDEFAFHLEQRIESWMVQGLSQSEANARARAQFGDIAGATAECSAIGMRRARRLRWSERLDTVAQDVRYALTGMRRAPAFTAATVLTIALGVGANTAVFSLLHALLLQPLDARDPRQLVRVYTSEGHGVREERDRFGASSYADYADLAHTPGVALAASMPLSATVHVQVGGEASRIEARVVSDNYFTLLGRPPAMGGWRARWSPADGPEVIVSHHFWTTQLQGDPSVIGRLVIVNGRPARVAGVTDGAFRGIEPSTVDLYVPFHAASALGGQPDMLTDRGDRAVRLLGRLAPGVTVPGAERALDGAMHALGEAFPETNARRQIAVRAATSIVPMELTGPGVIPTAGLVFGTTLVMLAIAAVNVAGVLLARTVRRRRELAVRLSLGASRGRVVRQLLTESVMLALVAALPVMAMLSLLPVLASALGVPRSIQPSVDPAVLAYALTVALGSGMLFGLGPALAGVRSDVVAVLRAGQLHTRPSRARAQRVLVCAQLALSMVLLTIGSALLRSLAEQQRVDPGFSLGHLVVGQLEDPLGGVDAVRERTFTKLAAERLHAVPGVTHVSVASMAPLTSDGMRSTIHIPGYVPSTDENMEVPTVSGGPELFATLGIPLRRGRELSWTDRDTAPKVVVNTAMARRYWPARDPVGSIVHLGGPGGRPAEVIGISGDARFRSLSEAPGPLYVVQRVVRGGYTVLVRSVDDAEVMLPVVRSALTRGDIPLTLVSLRTMDDVVRASLVATRAVTGTLMTIGALAVLLAAVGLYGVVSYITAGRGREFGVRLALGASRGSITRLVLGYGVRMSLIGGAIGAALGLAVVRSMGAMFFGSGNGLPAIVVAGGALCAVTLMACAVPAWRATASSPASALRSE